MKTKSLLILGFLLTIFSVSTKAQVTILQDEDGTNLGFNQIYSGNFDQGYVNCNFNRAKGMLSIGAEMKSGTFAEWDEIRIAFQWGGTWYKICEFWSDNNNNTNAPWETTTVPFNANAFTVSGNYPTMSIVRSKVTETREGKPSIYIFNNGNLKRYNGNYLPQAGDLQSRSTPADNAAYSIQTRPYSANNFYPTKNPSVASGDMVVSTGWDVTNYKIRGNLPGVASVSIDGDHSSIFINITNLPPEMLESPNFRVHIYGNSSTPNRDRIYETVYNNPNFMTTAPVGLSATKNLCGKVDLSWSNSGANILPTDGAVNLKYVIFRDGAYLAMVPGTQTTYSDLTAAQDVEYEYSVRHVAFSESQDTYFRSPATAPTIGSVKPSPDEPITPSASIDKCTGLINLAWGFNGANPDKFRIDYATNSGGPFTMITNTVSGGSRSFSHTGLTRGQQYYYRIYAINSCSVLSTTYAECNGISPSDPTMATSVTAVSNTVTNAVDLTWQDNANNETKYQVVRTDDVGNTVLTDINPNQTAYADASAAACRLYTYKIRVFNDCKLSGIVSASQATVTLTTPDLDNTFTSTKKLTASKGYFSNRVELSWSNNNGVNIDVFKIYRKQLGTTLDSVQITALPGGNALYIDNTADARVFYRYTIVGVKTCNGDEEFTNISSDIGFRNPTGLVSGHIEYNGGVAVNGAKVFVQQSSATLAGNSLKFSPTGTLSIADGTKLEPGAQMRCEFWLKPTVTATGNILNKANAFSFSYNGSNWVAGIYTGGVQKTVSVPTASVVLNNWNQIAMIYNGSALKVFINGVYTNSVTATGNIDDTNNNLIFGDVATSFYLDEFRLLGQSQVDSIITIDANRILNGDETSFKCNLHFNEAVGNNAYDVSKVGNFFNENHAVYTGTNVTWSSDIPTSTQLGYFGVTNSLGNYVVSGIQYLGSGENFNLVPNYQTHQFSPNSRSVYIGDGTNVYNNQDFLDISSFPFTGTLFYKGTTCPVPGAGLLIDGLPVLQNGQQAQTDAAGTFSISVPIGNHYVSISKPFHTMEAGRYPITGTHNFQAPLSNISFIDSTLVTIVGRVVGGEVEAKKAPNLGRSKNNIGKARLKIVSPLTGTPCFTMATITNNLSGEYIFRVPPLIYKLDSAFVITNSVVISKPNLTNTSQIIDVTGAFNVTNIKDTLRDSNGGIVSIDSTNYNLRRDFIYRNTPIIDVTSMNGSKFIGEDTLAIGTNTVLIAPVAGNMGAYSWGPFNWPVFKENKAYSAKIHASEIYTNTDNMLKDTVKLSGDILVTNDLVNGIDPNANFSFANGVATYSFICGSPNISTNPNPILNYTKDIQIVVVPDGAASVSWYPNTLNTPAEKDYHAIVLGKRITGTGISTQGPEQVEFILRDPPGSESFSSWTTGTTVEKSSFFSKGGGGEVGVSTEVRLGNKTMFGVGVITEFDMQNKVELGLTIQTSGSDEDGIVEQVTSSYGVATRDDAGNVGAPADIFIGRSKNWLVGPTTNIELIDASKCGPDCFGPNVGGKRLSKMYGYAIAPDDIRTRFSYTQNEIETVVIPGLESVRQAFLLNPTGRYISNIPVSNPKFGSNNDDPLWGAARTTTTTTEYEKADTTGASYTFKGLNGKIADTVRIINTQIALWKQALARNEKEKLACKNNQSFVSGYISSIFGVFPIITTPMLLDNFTLGSAIVTNAYTSSKTEQSTSTWELNISESVSGGIGGFVGGAGVLVKPSLTIEENIGGVKSKSTTNENTFEYTLTDGDPGDIMSIDVYKLGSGNVFITRGGQTMCPYEDAVVCHYYNPTSPDAWIGSHTYNTNGFATIANATVQREMPNIAITPAVQFNIPSNQSAVYQLNLSNQSPLSVNNDIDLQVRIASVSNPNGAVLKIDGQDANAIFNIPSGGSIIKTLTIERGPIEIDYDSLMVIFSSACSEDIADTAYVSVHFIPTCTELTINTPVNNFIINNLTNSLQNVIIDGYNYNYGTAQNTSTLTNGAHPNFGLEKIGFEFKPSNSSQWLQVQDFFKYPNAIGSNSLYPIPQGQIYTQYGWTVTPNSYADGNYEIRSVSYCYNKDGSYATVYSPVHTGVMDRVNPHPFGTPTPGDGILDPNDDISIQFNEPIDISSLSYAPVTSSSTGNFDIRGVLNGSDIRHNESLNFDGTADYAEVTAGAGLQKRSFTFEFWAKLNQTGINQTVISQGTDPNQFMTIGFAASDKLLFTLGTQTVLSTNPISIPTDWHHYAVSYDYQNADANLYIDGSLAGTNNNFIVDYIGSGKLAFGKAIPANNNFFNGNVHEVRLWNKVRTISEITMTMNKVLNRNQSGLVYNWKMDEADGSLAKDGIRSRDANIYGATWEVNPNGNAAQFDGADDNLQISSGNIAINKEMDFTIEFWFNSNQAGVSTLFSNGAGLANTADSLNAWTIQKDATGKIHVYHKGLDFVAVNTNYFDNNWHHFALVMQRTGNLSAYVDGNLQNSVQGINFNNLAGANMYLGAKATNAGATTTLSDYYSGKMDEFRLWNTARKVEQIKRDKQNRMLGDEAGLMAYVPFENYALVIGTPSLTPTFNNQSQITLTVNAQNGTSLIAQTPTVKLPRPVQSVNYTWSLNNDKIILSTTTAPELIENVTLDITVQNAYDMRGNKMQSPKTWIAYINKNQVKWQDDEFNFEKTVDSVITFVAPIVNSGGAQKAYTIGGVPSWMTSSTTNGVIAPNSVQNVTFTIPAGQSVGDYNAGITVTTDFNHDEVLQINLKVKGTAPNWTINTAAYQHQMNIFGQLKIDGVISSSTDSKLAAFCNGQIRGVANLQYVPAYDKYEVFLNVYSNSVSGDSIYFNIYDGATGLTFVTVDSSLTFVDNDLVGTVSNPRTFSANTEISRNIPLNAGWTWVSFPLKTTKMVNSNSMMASISASNGDKVTGTLDFDQYHPINHWVGPLSQNGGYKNNQTYKINKAVADTLIHIGSRLNPDSVLAQINVVPGWNWIGFVANKNLPINDALANYNAVTGDLIKSQYQFAYYDNLTGWSGSLTHMKPTLGYMLKSTSTSTFSYPLSGILGARMAETASTSNSQEVFPFTPEQYSNTMSMIIKGNICNEALAQGNVAVGVFDSGNNLHGYAYPVITNTTYVFYLTAYSNSNSEELVVKYFNTTDASVIATNTMVTFNTDALVGTPSQPFMANVDESLSCQVLNITTGIDQIDNSLKVSVYPNPFTEQINLQFNKAVNAKMELVDVLGKVVYSSSIKGKKEVVLMNYNLADGVYYVRLTGDINKQIKVVKTK